MFECPKAILVIASILAGGFGKMKILLLFYATVYATTAHAESQVWIGTGARTSGGFPIARDVVPVSIEFQLLSDPVPGSCGTIAGADATIEIEGTLTIGTEVVALHYLCRKSLDLSEAYEFWSYIGSDPPVSALKLKGNLFGHSKEQFVGGGSGMAVILRVEP
jgi:hypothetical protein